MRQPKQSSTTVVLQGAVITGDVEIGNQSSIWHNAVLRGDDGPIRVGARSNIQDGCVLHSARDSAVLVGDDVTVGHACILHGCTIEDGVLVGMGSIVMDYAVLGAGSVIGAGSLVTQGTQIPAGWLAFGRPAKPMRQLTEKEIEENFVSANEYVEKAEKSKQ